MNSHWMAAVREDGKKLVFMNFQTSHEIILPPLDDIEFYLRGPSHLDYVVSWTHLVLQKIVICQVPTRHADYPDFKLIALFDRGSPIFPPVPSLAGDSSARSGSSSKLIHTSVMLLNTMAPSTRSTKQMAPRIAGTEHVSCFHLMLMMTPWHCLNFLWWLTYPYFSRIWVELWQCIRDTVNQLYLEWVNSCDCDHVITANLFPWIIKWMDILLIL